LAGVRGAPVGIGRDEDEMHVVRHQAPGPHLDLGGAAMGGEQIVIKRIVMVAEDGSGAAIATLRDMERRAKSIKCTVIRNSLTVASVATESPIVVVQIPR
jgi:hypothetical protein